MGLRADPGGRRRRGGAKTRWEDGIAAEMAERGLGVEDCEDRSNWREKCRDVEGEGDRRQDGRIE